MKTHLSGVISDADLKALRTRNAQRIEAVRPLVHHRRIDLWRTDVSKYWKLAQATQ